MVILFIAALSVFVLITTRFGHKPNFGIRFLITVAKIPRHRATLAAMCPTLPRIPPDAADSLPIHTTVWGDAGPTVLLIHGGVQVGLGGGPATFLHQRALTEHGWRLVVPDRPGFGQSPSRGPDDMEADAKWVTTRLEDGAHLIGHSFGGAVALLAAARRPSAVRSLILIEPALVPLLVGKSLWRSDASVREDFLGMLDAWVSAQTPEEY